VTVQESRLDLERRRRLGMVEAVWGEHKSVDQIVAILQAMQTAGELALVTRVDAEKAAAVRECCPAVQVHHQAACLTLGEIPVIGRAAQVAVLSGGTSDRCVSEEASLALRVHGVATEPFLDVGVAGLHRLLDVLPDLAPMSVLIACAGMEGALPTVLAGLVPQPVIGVPVSVGYGVSAGGRAALDGMLASCAPGLSVVNIDNGYGAAMAALRILKGAAFQD
tara:strand:+ start:3989 stop:4654 length:666 start_codon:yes stop_codon:yes gene_type:complete